MNQMTPPLLISLSLWWTYLCFCALHLSRGPSKKCHWCRGINSSVVPQWLQFSKAFKVMAFWDLADECLFTELTPFIFDRHFFVSLLSVSLSGEEILSFKSLLLSYCGCPSVLLGTFHSRASTVWSHSNPNQGYTRTEWTTKTRLSGEELPEVKGKCMLILRATLETLALC